MSLSAVRCYEEGKRNPSIDVLIRIAHTCDLALSAFLAPLDTFKGPDGE